MSNDPNHPRQRPLPLLGALPRRPRASRSPCAGDTKMPETPRRGLSSLSPHPHAQVRLGPQNPSFRVDREERWKSFFFFPYFFPFQPRREPKWRLEMAVAGCPESLVPTVLSRAVHSFCRLHARGRARGLHLIVCRPLCVVSHTTGSCHHPSSSTRHSGWHLIAVQLQNTLGTRMSGCNDN